jgi:hypothetical protein
MMSAILKAPDNIEPEMIRYMKLEATWILTNISFGDEGVIETMLLEEYDLIKHFNLILESDDHLMFDQVIWLIANIAATSHALKKKMLSETYAIDEMYKKICKNGTIKKGHLKTIIWCICNLA